MAGNLSLKIFVSILLLFASSYAIAPSIGLKVVYPPGNLSVNMNHYFLVSLNLSCSIADCGDINVSLDPLPPQCYSYTSANWDAYSVYTGDTHNCANSLTPGWYRFTGTYHAIPVQGAYVQQICGTDAPGFLNFTYPTGLGQTTSGNICYNWNNNNCQWFSPAQVTQCSGYYVFNLTSSPTCSLYPCSTDAIPDPPVNKGGLVNDTLGALPFYTNQSNPRTVNLNASQSQIVDFWVMPTVQAGDYAFFAYANLSAAPAISNQTSNWTVSVYPEPSVFFNNIPPSMTSAVTPVNVTINITTAYFFGTNESPTLDKVWWTDGVGTYPYNSPVVSQFAYGAHNLTAFANDTEGNVYNSTANFTVSSIQCGGNISTSFKMNGDLNCSGYSGDALHVISSNLVFDCAGHTIIGPGDYDGIYLEHVSNVTIQNCKIFNFYDAIYSYFANESFFWSNNLSESSYGLYLDYSPSNSVMYNDFYNDNIGFYVYYADNNKIGYNHVVSTGSSNFGGGSCPFIFLGNGSSYSYYTDAAGEPLGAPWFKPQYYQAGVYELGDYAAVNGTYLIKLREVLPESDYVDLEKLAIVDVPSGYSALSEWSNTYQANQPPDTGFMTIKDPVTPVSATDSYGNDVLSEISAKDGVPVGVANDTPNPVTLDFGSIANPQYAKLILSGWSAYYQNPSLSPQPYVKVETMDQNGSWVVRKEFGGFIGDERTIVFNLSGVLQASDTRMRIIMPSSSSTMQVIDQAQLDDSPPVAFNVTYVDPSVADLKWGGSTSFDYPTIDHRNINVTDDHLPAETRSLMYGNFTKYGDVRPLLSSADNEFAVMRHGDELDMAFPDIPKPAGTERRVFLVSDAMYTIKYSIKGFVSGSIDPMPFHGMTSYPYGANQSYPDDSVHQQYRSDWNTRVFTSPVGAGGSLPYSFNNTVFNNVISGDLYSTGLYLEYEDSTKLLNNQITGVQYGIDLYDSVNGVVSGNLISTVNGPGVYLDWNSHNNSVIGNNIITDDGIAYSIYAYSSYDNTILHNTMRSDYWVYDDSEGVNFYNDSSTGNTYYFYNGTGAWMVYNITDTSGNGYADVGSDLPFSSGVVGPWSGSGEDWHPGVPTSLSVTHGGNGAESYLDVQLTSDCNGTYVTVTSNGQPVQGATVSVSDSQTLADIASGTTDAGGMLSFQGCGATARIYASKDGYTPASADAGLVACGSCAPPPKCQNDSDCATDQKCQLNDDPQLNQCVLVSCSCGQVAQDHECTGPVYQCGTGANCAQCPAGQVCSANNVCVPSGCTSDLQCKDNEVCRTASGAPGTANTPGSCQNVTGECGIATNHTFVPYGYECGTEPGCPSCASGQSCVDHKCVQNDITCPSTVVVGDNANCQVTQNNQACGPADNCTTVVTAPDGTNTTVAPDDAGNVLVGATIQGRYKIDLLKNGQVVKEVFVDVVPKSQPTETQPPTSAGGGADLTFLWVLLLLIIVVGAFVYWRSRGGKK